MYKLQYLNITVEVESEIQKDELISKGYELIEKTDNKKEDTNDEISKNEENDEDTQEDNKKGKKGKK